MARPEGAFELAGKEVVVETFVDEAVALHLGTGRYYSINMSGAEILDLIGTGNDLDGVVAYIATRYGTDRHVVDGPVADFVGQLLEEGLIRSTAGASASLPEGPRSSEPFAAPTISVYTDMEDLLLLDPVHDVDETGWPTRVDVPDDTQGASHTTE